MFAPLRRARPLLSALLLWFLFLALLIPTAILFARAINGEGGRYVYGFLGTVAALVATAVLLRVNRGSWTEAGLSWDQHTVTRFLAGAAVGLGLVCIILLLVFVSTGIRPMPAHGLTAATVIPLGALLPLALMEEIAFRGYPFAELRRKHGLWIAQIATAFAFSLYHILNGWPAIIAFVGPGAWAFVFGIAAARTGGIAAPTGLHFGINVAQALVGLGTATAATAAFELTDPHGLTGVRVAEQTTAAGLAAQALLVGIALFLTWRNATRPSLVQEHPKS